MATDLESTQPLLVLVGLCYALERLATEWWKSVLREDDQGAVLDPDAARGARATGRRPQATPRHRRDDRDGDLLAWWAARAIQHAVPPLPLWGLVLVAGIGGWLTAVGGAWKDAPVEGFSGWKFLRSPVVATAWAIVLSRFTGDWVLLTVAAAGWSVISIETYKTFLTGGRPPGKFAGKPVRFLPRAAREACRAFTSPCTACSHSAWASDSVPTPHLTAGARRSTSCWPRPRLR